MKNQLTKSEAAAAAQIRDCFQSMWKQGAVRNCCLLKVLLSRHFHSLKSTQQCWKRDSSSQEQWKWVLTVVFTETLKGGKEVSDVIEQFTVQKTNIRSKRNFNPVCRTLLKPKPFWGIELLVSFLLAFNLYVISAAMKLNTIAHHHNFRNHLIEIITKLHLTVPTLFLMLCSTFPCSSASYSWTLLSSCRGYGKMSASGVLHR